MRTCAWASDSVFAPRDFAAAVEKVKLDLQKIRENLLKEQGELLARLKVPVEIARGDEADLAATAENKERALWLANDAKMRLEQIDQALRRIETGTYGTCAHCGKPIPEERLRTLPLTRYDVECQGLLEKKRKR